MEKYLHLLSRGDKNWPDIDSSEYCNCFYVDWVIKVCPLRGRQHYTIRRKQSTNVVLL